jgi:flagellar basal-body rod modification protein FlgD
MEVNAVPNSENLSGSALAASQFADNFDTFLILLTQQLQNQDPLSPLDTDQFTAQLAQFTGVEQSIATNRHLENLLGVLQRDQAASAVNFLGKTVAIDGDNAPLTEGFAEWGYAIAAEANTTTISVLNQAGETVFTAPGQTAAGSHGFVWNGIDDNNVPQPDGIYRIAIAARDASGNPVAVTTALSGQVDAIESVEGQQMLVVGGKLIPIGDVVAVRETAPQGT